MQWTRDLLIKKDPDSVLDYQLDWSSWLGTDTISTSVFTVPTGLTKDSEGNTSTTSTVWLSGGTLNQIYNVVCRITTTGGRTVDRSFDVLMAEY